MVKVLLRQTLLILVLLLGAWPAPIPATAAPAAPAAPLPGFVDELVVTGLHEPTAMAWTPDGRLFIAEKSGRVRVFYQGQLLPLPFIDINAEVNPAFDRGLLGLAVHPEFPAKPYVYLLYTYDPPGLAGANDNDSPNGAGPRVSRLIRVTANPANLNVALPLSTTVLLGKNSTLANIGDPAAFVMAHDPHPPASCQAGDRPIVDCLPSDGPSHSIGTVLFAPDGSLLVGSGDGADWNAADPRALRAQDLDSLAGKILRIDPDTGLGYPDNPFFDGDAGSNRSRVLSFGLRNPFRFNVDPDGNRLFIGDVGWGGIEEVNVGIAKNFGWPCYEGVFQQNVYSVAPLTRPACKLLYDRGEAEVVKPIYHYSRDPLSGAAIIMGPVYSGGAYPVEYQGALFFADFTQRWLKYLTFDEQGQGTVHDFWPAQSNSPEIVQLINGPDGNLHYLHFSYNGDGQGQVRRLRYSPGGANQPPSARAVVSASYGTLPLQVSFSALASSDPDEMPFDTSLTFKWNFGDGATATGVTATHTYTQPLIHTATLTVTDSLSATSTSQVLIHAGNTPPAAAISAPAHGAVYTIGQTLVFSGNANDTQDGSLPGASLEWRGRLHQSMGTTEVPLTVDAGGSSGSLVLADHGDNVWLELCLTATDSGGLSHTACRAVLPKKVAYTFVTDPPGRPLIYQGARYQTPFTFLAVQHSERSLAAPMSYGPELFTGWADSVAISRTLEIGPTARTFTATYAAPHHLLLPFVVRQP